MWKITLKNLAYYYNKENKAEDIKQLNNCNQNVAHIKLLCFDL